jgi:hypothetical protein
MRRTKNLTNVAFQLEADGDFNKALRIWNNKKTFSFYPGAYVRAAEIARIQNKKKLLDKLLLKIHPHDIYEEFGTQLSENLIIEWVRQRGRFDTNAEVTSKIIAALWESDGEVSKSEIGKYSVASMQDLTTISKSTIEMSRPEVENCAPFRRLPKRAYKRVRFESSCVELVDAIATIGSNSFVVGGVCLVDEFRRDFPQVATPIDDPLIHGVRNREVLTPKFLPGTLRTIEKAFWLGLKYSSEHGHFVSTVLTRLYYFEKHEDWGNAPLVISSKLSPTHKGIIRLLYSSVDFLEIDEGTAISFANLVVAPTSVYSPTTVSRISKPPDWVFVDTSEFDWLHTKLRSASTNSTNLPKKIGIIRNSYSRRKLINADEWENLALENGYALIDPADLNAEDEINLFKNATHIIGEIGSWAFLSGLNPDSKVIILTHDKDFIIWNEVSQLNSLRNSKFRIIRGRRVIRWPNKVNLHNLHAEWKLTRTAIRKIESLV